MTLENTDAPNTAPEARSHTRRTVLRTGAHAAWAVPAVQVATMVPAMAASGPAKVVVTSTQLIRETFGLFNGKSRLRGVINLKNDGGSATGSLTIVLSNLVSQSLLLGTNTSSEPREAEWELVGSGGWVLTGGGSITAGTRGCTLSYAAGIPVGESRTVQFRINPEQAVIGLVPTWHVPPTGTASANYAISIPTPGLGAGGVISR